MVNDRLPDPSDPEAVGRAEFGTQRRGFDQLQVRSYLKVVARELQRLKDRELELTRDLDNVRRRLEEAERSAADLDESALTARLGEETARVLEAARTAAADKVRRAEESAAEMLARAKAEADEIVGSAQAVFDAELEVARAKGRELIAEARLIRERTLEDLAHRRRSMRTQVEQLRSGRDRLLASHSAIRKALDEIEQELEREMPEARVAAEFTGRRLQHEPPGSAGLIEIEIEEAKRAGNPLVTPDEIAASIESADWSQSEADADSGESEREAEVVHTDEPTDEIPVLDHFGAGEPVERPEIVLADVGHRKRDHRDLPREPVPVIEAPDDVEVVRVVSTGHAEDADEAVADEAAADDVVEATVEATATLEVDEIAVETEIVMAAVEPDTVADADEAAPSDADGVTPSADESDNTGDNTDKADDDAPRSSGVDDLFARIRESRAENVARAREVLDQPLETAAVAVAAPPHAETNGSEPAPAAVVAASVEEVELSPDAQRLADRDAAVADIEALVVRKLKRLLADEQNEIQDLVRRKQGKVDHDEILGERDHHVGRYVAAVGGELLGAVSAGASFYDPNAQSVPTDLSALDERLAHELLDPLRQLLARGVDDARGDEDELLDRVRSAYREVKSQRVDVAARVVTLSAFNLGIVSSQPAGGLLRWAVDPVGGCSPDCDDNALAGAVVAGEEFPTGAVYPPNHPGCRCLLVPADQ